MIRIANLIGRGMTFVSIALMIVLCIPVTYEAIVRALGLPTIWVFETTLYALIFMGFLGNALAVRSGAHFRVTLLMELMPNYRWVFNLIAHLTTLAFALLIIAGGLYFVWYSWSNMILSATMLEVPIWIPQLAIPLGGMGLFLQTLVLLVTGQEPEHSHMVGD
jgi:C4-dicarboxylate transporter, DctQ subunit